MGLNKQVIVQYEDMQNRLDRVEKAVGIEPKNDSIDTDSPTHNPDRVPHAFITEEKAEAVIKRIL